MSRDRRSNRDDDSRDARRAAKHADKKHGRSDFKNNIKDAIASGDFEDLEDLYEEDDRNNRR